MSKLYILKASKEEKKVYQRKEIAPKKMGPPRLEVPLSFPINLFSPFTPYYIGAVFFALPRVSQSTRCTPHTF